jgi:Histidine kinase-, DNA gyrase B-, and HSP90-like ATPase
MRMRAGQLAGRIAVDLPEFTVHDQTHLDALWGLGGLIAGPDLVLTPPESFVLGGAILLHDLGLAVAAYPGGRDELRSHAEWRDAAAVLMRQQLQRAPTECELRQAGPEILTNADQNVLRLRHATRAATLGQIAWEHSSGQTLYLIAAEDLRVAYGHIIGRIAASHWSSVDELADGLSGPLGALPQMPNDWTVRPLLLACLLRCADAAHLSADRAPLWSRIGRELGVAATSHWDFQEHLLQPQLIGDQLVFTSGTPFTPAAANAWWLCYDALGIADRELRDANALLVARGLPSLLGRSIRGAEAPHRLAELVQVEGWRPVDARIEVSDVARLVARLGGEALYGDSSDFVPLRELIQNAVDAEKARRSLQPTHGAPVVVRICQDEQGAWLEVVDNGIGMSSRVLSGALLDFGRSLWESPELTEVLPGLASSGFEPTGRFGIGFFSVFMWSDRVLVASRSVHAGPEETRVLEFNQGLAQRPLLRDAQGSEMMDEPGTRVRILLNRGPFAPAVPPGNDSRSLDDACRYLCPALDVDLHVDTDDDRQHVIAGGDWLTIDESVLLQRVQRIRDGEHWQGSSLQIIRDSAGVPLARIAFDPWGGGDAVLVAGGLRVSSITKIVGVVCVDHTDAARSEGSVVMPRAQISAWASEQAGMFAGGCEVWDERRVAGLICGLGGNVGPLMVCQHGETSLNLAGIEELCERCDEIVIADPAKDMHAAGQRLELDSWTSSYASDVVVATKENASISALRFDDGRQADDFMSVFDYALATARESMSTSTAPAVVEHIQRIVGQLRTPAVTTDFTEIEVFDVEGECVVVRRAE